MSAKQLVSAYLAITERIKAQRAVLAALREQEKVISAELSEYLNQNEDEVGLRVDERTVITLANSDKKINRTKKEYKAYLTELCQQEGLPDDVLVGRILDGKVSSVVQQQRLKIVRIK